MAKRSIEETFRAVTPSYWRGIPAAPTLTAGFSAGGAGNTSDVSSALSQAGQQIAQLQQSYQQQASLISANTQAIQGNTTAQGAHSGSTVGQTASSLFGGALGFLSPVISGIASLFGGGSSQPATLPIYMPPPPVSVNGVVTPTNPGATAAPQPAAQVTVNISAMDTQSILDRSNDIATAVQQAMLNVHPINSVIANL